MLLVPCTELQIPLECPVWYKYICYAVEVTHGGVPRELHNGGWVNRKTNDMVRKLKFWSSLLSREGRGAADWVQSYDQWFIQTHLHNENWKKYLWTLKFRGDSLLVNILRYWYSLTPLEQKLLHAGPSQNLPYVSPSGYT